jgi:hypothetical protein
MSAGELSIEERILMTRPFKKMLVVGPSSMLYLVYILTGIVKRKMIYC